MCVDVFLFKLNHFQFSFLLVKELLLKTTVKWHYILIYSIDVLESFIINQPRHLPVCYTQSLVSGLNGLKIF